MLGYSLYVCQYYLFKFKFIKENLTIKHICMLNFYFYEFFFKFTNKLIYKILELQNIRLYREIFNYDILNKFCKFSHIY